MVLYSDDGFIPALSGSGGITPVGLAMGPATGGVSLVMVAVVQASEC